MDCSYRMLLLQILTFLQVFIISLHFPREAKTHHEAWMNSGKFEGDIGGLEILSTDSLGIFRSAVANQFRLWIDAVVPYEIDGQFDSKERQIILTTIDHIHETTCVRFLPRTNEVDHVLIFRGKGCYSNVGKQGGCQNVSLDRGCMHHEVIVHELMHALGFWHEHSRHDRDEYVTIKWQNIDEIYHDQFQKVERAKMDDLDELYDYFSIMHYGSKAFSSSGENTIEANNPAFTKFLGKSIDLSEVDISKVRKLYKCHKSTTTGYETLSTTIKPKACFDKYAKCAMFPKFCMLPWFKRAMKQMCPKTCRSC